MTKKQPRKIKASRELLNKVGMGQITQEKINAAQNVIDTDKTDFVTLAKTDLDKLQKALNLAKDAENDSEPAEIMSALKAPIMNLKANSGAFKYTLVSNLTGMVLMLLENVEKPDKKNVQIVDILHKTILLSLAYKMEGDGGNAGKQLLEAFEIVCSKYNKSIA